jgi:hydroxymethylpyrimidine pyrophosphatase-like HAD family hydrolase
MLRLLVTDVDRTILTHDHELPNRVKEQLARAREAGVLLVLATARSPMGVLPYAEQLRPDWTICFNGGWTGDPKSGARSRTALRRSPIERDAALTVMTAALAEGLRAMWFSETGIHVLEDDEVVRREAAITNEPLHVARSLDDLPDGAGKIMCVALEAERQQTFELIRAKFRNAIRLALACAASRDRSGWRFEANRYPDSRSGYEDLGAGLRRRRGRRKWSRNVGLGGGRSNG